MSDMNMHLYDKLAVTVAVALESYSESKDRGLLVEKVTKDLMAAFREELPQKVDIESKWEMSEEDTGIYVTLTGEKTHDDYQLKHLARFASDQGYNTALAHVAEDLYVPSESDILKG